MGKKTVNTAETGTGGKDNVVVRSLAGLNLRVGPGKGHPIKKVLADGAELTEVEIPEAVAVPGWLAVTDGKVAGWVKADFIAPKEV